MSHLTRIDIDPTRADSVLPVLWQLQLSHYNEKVRWALDYKQIPHIRRSLLPGPHRLEAKRLTGDISTTPVLTIAGRSIGDSTRIISAIEERWPQPRLYPEDEAQRRRALELEEFFDEELGPHFRRAMYHEMLPHPELLLARFTNGQPPERQRLLRDRYPALRAAIESSMEINPETAAASRAKTGAAMDRLEREISTSGYLVGTSFTIADLTAAALFYGVVRPPEFPYPVVAHDDLPDSWREFLDSLAQRPGGRWVTEIYRRHRARSAELGAAEEPPTLPIDEAYRGATSRERTGPTARTSRPDLPPSHQTETALLSRGSA
jgi:glutathione S-transferase